MSSEESLYVPNPEDQPSRETEKTKSPVESSPSLKLSFAGLFGSPKVTSPTKDNDGNKTERKLSGFGRLMQQMSSNGSASTVVDEKTFIAENNLNKEEQDVLKALNEDPKNIISKFINTNYDTQHLKICQQALEICCSLAASEEEDAKTEEDCKYSTWLSKFLKESGGLTAIADCLASSSLANLSISEDETATEEKELKQVYCLKCIEIVLSASDLARSTFFKNKDLLKNMVLLLDSRSLEIRAQIFMLLSIVMNLSVDNLVGFELILDALTTFKLIKRESKRFEFLIETLQCISEEDIEAEEMLFGTISVFTLSCLIFFNSLISVSPNEGAKVNLLKELKKIDLHLVTRQLHLQYDTLCEQEQVDLEDDKNEQISNIFVQVKMLEKEFSSIEDDDDDDSITFESLDDVDLSDPVAISKTLTTYLISLEGKESSSFTSAHNSFINVMNSILRFAKYGQGLFSFLKVK